MTEREGDKFLRAEMVLSDEQLRAIGCIAVESTYLDNAFDSIVKETCGLGERDFRVLTAGAQMAAKLTLVRELTLPRIKAEAADKLKRFLDDAGQLVTKRNNVIHGRWVIDRVVGHSSNNNGIWSSFKWERKGEARAIRKKRGELGETIFKSADLMQIAWDLSRVRNLLMIHLIENGLLSLESAPPRQRAKIQSRILGSSAKTKEQPKSPPKPQE